MNPEHDIESRVERWLKAEARPMPPQVLTAVREVVPRTSQLGRLGPIASERWSRWYGRLGLLAAAAVLVIVAGPAAFDQLRTILHWPDGVGQGVIAPSPSPAASPPPSASPSPAASPTTSPSASPSASPDPFTGTWSTIDVDGSPMTIAFDGNGPTRNVVVEDLRASTCAGEHHVTDGVGTIEGSSIRVVGRGGCAGRPKDLALNVTWTYDPEAGTLRTPADWVTGLGTFSWTRGPVKPDAFNGSWIATDIDGSSMTLSLSGSGLTRDVSYVDDRALDCSPGAAFLAQGSGTIGSVVGDGRFISVSLHGSCAGGASPKDSVEKYKYDYVTDTLIGPLTPLDIGGDPLPQTVTWRRG